jgi:hypothetical protein
MDLAFSRSQFWMAWASPLESDALSSFNAGPLRPIRQSYIAHALCRLPGLSFSAILSNRAVFPDVCFLSAMALGSKPCSVRYRAS